MSWYSVDIEFTGKIGDDLLCEGQLFLPGDRHPGELGDPAGIGHLVRIMECRCDQGIVVFPDKDGRLLCPQGDPADAGLPIPRKVSRSRAYASAGPSGRSR